MPRVAHYVPKILKKYMGIIGWNVQALSQQFTIDKSTLGANLSGKNGMSLRNALTILKVLKKNLPADKIQELEKEQMALLEELDQAKSKQKKS